ncbi:MAG: hypothetical protein IPG23_28725 [Burkholderiales bacterium]|nr:hypothetical protein [Burkholderiales bacterium]
MPVHIQAYPPGVRENGGQYAHAGVWALMAVADYARNNPQALTHKDDVYRYFTYLSPAHRAKHVTRGPRLGTEPYVMTADIYTQPPYVRAWRLELVHQVPPPGCTGAPSSRSFGRNGVRRSCLFSPACHPTGTRPRSRWSVPGAACTLCWSTTAWSMPCWPPVCRPARR